MVHRECTRHHRCSLRKISQTGEVKSALPDLDSLLLALVLIILAESLPLGLSRLRAHLSKVTRAPTLETSVVVVRASCLLSIRPGAGLLLLLLRRLNNPTAWLRGSLRVQLEHSAQYDTSVRGHSRVQQVPYASFQHDVQR